MRPKAVAGLCSSLSYSTRTVETTKQCMDRTGSLGSGVHPSEHAVRITFNSPEGQQPNASRLVIKTVQAHATFKRAVLLPDEHGLLPEKSYQPQFWFMKLTVPKGLPLQKGTSVDGIRLKPDGRQFGSDGCKDALKEVSSISLKRCHYVVRDSIRYD